MAHSDSKADPPAVTNPLSRRGSWLVLLIVAVLLVGGAGAYRYFTLSRPIGSGPAGPAVPKAPFAKPWTTRPVLLVGLGDSITAGFGARKGYGYFERLAANPPEEDPAMKGLCLSAVLPQLLATNLAVSGSISHEVEGQLAQLPQAASNVLGWVVLTTGGNDLIHNYGRTPPREQAMFGASLAQAAPWIDRFEQRLDVIVTNILARFPGGCHIFLANIYDPTDGVGDLPRAGLPAWTDGKKVLAAYNQALRRCAEKHPQVHWVDFYSAFLGHGIHCTEFWRSHYHADDPHYWYYYNLEDPNERGYDAIRRLFLLEMTQVAQRELPFGPAR